MRVEMRVDCVLQTWQERSREARLWDHVGTINKVLGSANQYWTEGLGLVIWLHVKSNLFNHRTKTDTSPCSMGVWIVRQPTTCPIHTSTGSPPPASPASHFPNSSKTTPT